MMKITIKDVAKEAGVSIATVSRVLNNKDRVKKTTKKRVEAAIEKLNFKPNQVARTMIMKETKSIGLLVPHLSNEYWSQLAEVIQEELWKAGYTVLISVTSTWENPLEREIAFLNNFIQRNVDGIIYCSINEARNNYNPFIMELSSYHIPVVTVDQDITGVNQIRGDHINGATMAVEHLIGLGHKQIAHIGGPLLSPDRELGYRGAHFINGLFINESIIKRGHPTFQFGYEAMNDLLEGKSENPFSAVFCGNDLIALGVMRSLGNAGLQLPGDVAVVGYDDIQVSSMVKPALTTVKQPIREMGAGAVELLLNSIEKGVLEGALPLKSVYPMELVIRDSCGASKKSNH